MYYNHLIVRYGGVGIMRKDFCEATAKYELDFSKPIDIKCPVRIVHAIKVAIFTIIDH